jgi:hypothetical protein
MVLHSGAGLEWPYRDYVSSQDASWGRFVESGFDPSCSAAVSRLFHLDLLVLIRLSIAKKATGPRPARCDRVTGRFTRVAPRASLIDRPLPCVFLRSNWPWLRSAVCLCSACGMQLW